MIEDRSNVAMPKRALPRPRLVFPRYTNQQIFEVFSAFLSEQAFTYTHSVLSKELLARGFAPPAAGDADPTTAPRVGEIAADDDLREHLALPSTSMESSLRSCKPPSFSTTTLLTMMGSSTPDSFSSVPS